MRARKGAAFSAARIATRVAALGREITRNSGGRRLDERLKPFIKDTKPAHLKDELATQICEVSGGPCKRDGADMKRVHDDFQITRGDFDRLVEVLQFSMEGQGIPFATQNRLLARLAPMQRDIVNVH